VSHSVRDIASNITPPTLLIAGDKDDITPLPVQEELHRLMPTSTLRVIKNVGHLTHYETPNEVAKIVQDFIKSE
jgi:pimeloyl-ACP methyl ester carboxylesterase